LQNQVGDNGNVNKLEQVLLSLEDVNVVDAVDAETKEKAVNAVDAETKENMANEDNPEQGLPSQVGEMNIVDEDHEDEDVIVGGIGSDPNFDADSEHDEDHGDVNEVWIVIDSDVILIGISTDSDSNDDSGVDAEYMMHKEAENRDVVDDINLKREHNDEKTVETQEHEKSEKRDGTSSSSITYHTRQSSTKTEAVPRYVDLPFVNQFMQLVTPLPNP
jgi:hypothetical protein